MGKHLRLKIPSFRKPHPNRAESAHASKHSLGTSSGKLKTVILKVKKWCEELVADSKHRLMVECIGENTTILFNKRNAARLNDIRHKIGCNCPNQLSQRRKTKSADVSLHTINCSHVIISLLNLISFQFPVFQDSREENAWKAKPLTLPMVFCISTKVSTTHRANNYKLIFNYQSKKIAAQIVQQKLEDLNSPKIVEAIKGLHKNTKRKIIALEHCIENEKEQKTTKLVRAVPLFKLQEAVVEYIKEAKEILLEESVYGLMSIQYILLMKPRQYNNQMLDIFGGKLLTEGIPATT
ncbi:hypothetical protein PHYBLDRAFT_171726 [Phycomyces blakesleeanus NRRL 1555(-)]|uniref:Uncharacterized protein n=1 Tax=Phycomyces blakesleeanus (strain ATCC 8743b / DSM 1359 / FGSC 10004 / NBRC 33097 / NRRL 1555) TaxID=763407 RepID=A0A162TWD1_PHYB8|nr:hypothetical protein PHYBLDRAFT_171726 [Phycomyces blakesleeanus NRRL 1555(-)]OAD70343.1 hypothetical protein PHYBLDRAFT_171726 [Phycomyces blakesleeanus NRRL 1555(-)]|eukprot:XP_018288383.1 hypothetical protein PHYBLDRAFT_171726 [Phycomyces blakesleeanus NRRL 1555(-)]